jgi:hypothetical protein
MLTLMFWDLILSHFGDSKNPPSKIGNEDQIESSQQQYSDYVNMALNANATCLAQFFSPEQKQKTATLKWSQTSKDTRVIANERLMDTP